MLKNCVKCGGELAHDGNGFRCVACGWEFNLSALSYGGADIESKNATEVKTVGSDPLFKNCENPIVRRAAIMTDDGDFKGAISACQRALVEEPENAHAHALLMLCFQEARSFDELMRGEKDFSQSTQFKDALKFGYEALTNKLLSLTAERKYYKACELLRNAKEIDYNGEIYAEVARASRLLDMAVETFDVIFDFNDSAKLAKECKELRAYYDSDEFWYDYAVNKLEKSSIKCYDEAIMILIKRNHYKDSDRLIEEYRAARDKIVESDKALHEKIMREIATEEKTGSKRVNAISLLFAFIGIFKLVANAVSYVTMSFEPFYGSYWELDEWLAPIVLALRAGVYAFIFASLFRISIEKNSNFMIPAIMIPISVALPATVFYMTGVLYDVIWYYVAAIIAVGISVWISYILSGRLYERVSSAIEEYVRVGFFRMNQKRRTDFTVLAAIAIGVALVI